jgi:hypothetical protein
MVLSILLFMVFLLSNKWVFGYVGSKYGFAVAHGRLLLGCCSSKGTRIGWVLYDPFVNSTLGWQPSYAFDRSGRVILDLWQPLLIMIVLTAIAWLANRFRFPVGHCQKCGYDLRGNLSGVCPECGTTITKDNESKPTGKGSKFLASLAFVGFLAFSGIPSGIPGTPCMECRRAPWNAGNAGET